MSLTVASASRAGRSHIVKLDVGDRWNALKSRAHDDWIKLSSK